jgi:hypothetical protein
MTTVDIRLVGRHLSPHVHGVLGAVEISDNEAFPVAHTVLRAHGAEQIRLPGPGRYTAAGRMFDGTRLTRSFDTGGRLWDLRWDKQFEPPASVAIGGTRLWHHDGLTWDHVGFGLPLPAQLPSAHIVIGRSREYCSAAVQVPAADQWQFTIVPLGSRLQVTDAGVSLAVGTGLTVLRLMQRGHLAAAGVVVREILADEGGDPVSDILAGYWMLQRPNDRLALLRRRLLSAPRPSADMLLIAALTAPAGLDVGPKLLEALEAGPPAFWIGLRVLAEALQSAYAQSRRPDLRQAFSKVAPYLLAARRGGLTAFPGEAPDRPRPVTSIQNGRPSLSKAATVADRLRALAGRLLPIVVVPNLAYGDETRPRTATLTFTEDLSLLFGERATATVFLKRSDTAKAIVLIDRVSDDARGRRIAVSASPTGDFVTFTQRQSVWQAELDVEAGRLPESLYFRITHSGPERP